MKSYNYTNKLRNLYKYHTGFLQQEGGSWEEWEGPSSVVCDGGSGLRKMSPIEQQIHDYRISQQRRINEVSAPQEEEPNLFEVLIILPVKSSESYVKFTEMDIWYMYFAPLSNYFMLIEPDNYI